MLLCWAEILMLSCIFHQHTQNIKSDDVITQVASALNRVWVTDATLSCFHTAVQTLLNLLPAQATVPDCQYF